MKTTRPYGVWKSPISGKTLVQSSLRLGQIQIDGESVYWSEGRPSEKGRTALMSRSSQDLKEITQSDIDVRTRVHEYGGGAFLCAAQRKFYVDNSDQQIYEILGAEDVKQVTYFPEYRFADMILDLSRNLLFSVGENHNDPNDILNCLVTIDLKTSELRVIAEGHDFYSNPQLSPNGNQLLFLVWDHPNMPWDGTQLISADLNPDGSIASTQVIVGGTNESIFQPLWDPDGSFYFVSDRNKWWNIYHFSNGQIQIVLEKEAEFGSPQWVCGMSNYAVLESGELIATYSQETVSHLVRINVEQGKAIEIETDYTHIDQLVGTHQKISFIGYSDRSPSEIVEMNLDTLVTNSLRKSQDITIDPAFISTPEHISFESGPRQVSYAWYYAPLNPDYQGPAADFPPLIVLSHGGPTGNSFSDFKLATQYWTSRGFAVVDVNYSGSTGYGRDYRERLNGKWGILDVDDCVAAANFLIDAGYADGERLIIKGGSAGGFTTLSALTFKNVFKAGASYYGVGDLSLLAQDTHKFESRYLDGLIGPYPEEEQVYYDRSPLNFSNELDCPVIFLQGLDDPVVPPAQAEGMVAALKKNGIPVAYLPFEGESHGFRQSTTMIKAIESEYYFYLRIFGLETDESIEPIDIFNLD